MRHIGMPKYQYGFHLGKTPDLSRLSSMILIFEMCIAPSHAEGPPLKQYDTSRMARNISNERSNAFVDREPVMSFRLTASGVFALR